MEHFAFLIHPMDMGHITRKYRMAKKIPEKLVTGTVKRKKPWAISEITGIRSITGKEAMGWFIIVPLLPSQILNLREKYVVKKIVKACEVAKKQGAGIVGLGAFTACVGGAGKDIADATDVAITTGNSYTVSTAIEGAKKAARIMDIDLRNANIAVVGATGSIGKVAAEILAAEAGALYLVGRDQYRLDEVKETIFDSLPEGDYNIIASTDISGMVKQADVIITVTSAIDFVIQPEDIKSGAVVCDVARPRDVAEIVKETRDDVLVIDGGVVRPPGHVDFHFDFGLPPDLALACMAETMILALEGRYEDYTIGRDIRIDQIRDIENLAEKHGFELAGFRSFEKALTDDDIQTIKMNATKVSL
jgi:predicted amino acid dehydrogenase